MAKIFISYRREDSEWPAHKLRDAILPHLASRDDLFMDVHSIPFGVDFETYLGNKVAECDMLLAVIGPRWLDVLKARESGGGADYVRAEIAAALTRGIPVVPILIDPARVPVADELTDDLKPLSKRNAPPPLRAAFFDADIDVLIRGLGLAAPTPAPVRPELERTRSDGVEPLPPSEFNEADYVFVSHPRDIDPVLMRAIVRTIIADGHSVWLYDPVGLGFRVDELVHMRWQQAGGAWEGQTLDALRKASSVLLLVSRTSLQKGFQAQEIKQAATRTGVVTIVTDDLPYESLPRPIAGRFARRITTSDLETGASEKLLAVLGRDIATAGNGPPAATPKPARTGLYAGLASIALIGGGGTAAYFGGMLSPSHPPPVIEQTAEVGRASARQVDLEAEADGGASPALPEDESTDTTAADAAARSEAIGALQRALSGIGLYSSGIDGAAGAGTRAAAARFASETNAPAIDLETATPGDIAALTARVEAEAIRRAERESAAWSIAERTDTIAAYRAYLADYPSGANASAARSRVAALTPPEPSLDADEANSRGGAAWSRGDFATARREYEASCNAGSAIGCYGLGYLYDYGNGVPQDHARARTLYTQACDGGVEQACTNLTRLPS